MNRRQSIIALLIVLILGSLAIVIARRVIQADVPTPQPKLTLSIFDPTRRPVRSVYVTLIPMDQPSLETGEVLPSEDMGYGYFAGAVGKINSYDILRDGAYEATFINGITGDIYSSGDAPYVINVNGGIAGNYEVTLGL
jgi:hypothetical protein